MQIFKKTNPKSPQLWLLKAMRMLEDQQQFQGPQNQPIEEVHGLLVALCPADMLNLI